jgi:putative peptidoglycan lipid II flippase
VLIWPVLRKQGVHFRWSLNVTDPNVRGMIRMFVPVVLGQGVLLLSVFLDSQICTFLTQGPQDPTTRSFLGMSFAYPLHEGALSAVNNAQRLYQFPLGVLAISLATAAFPMFSLYASRQDYAGLRTTLGQSMRVAIFEGLPCGVVLFVLAEPIIALLFQHGRFTSDATARAAWVLKWYAIGMPAYCCQQIVLRGFYSLKDTMTPMWIGCALVTLNLAINVTLLWNPWIGEAAFGIGTAITSTIHVAVSLWLLRKRLAGRIGGTLLLTSLIKTLIASAAAGLAAWAVLRMATHWDLIAWGRIGSRGILVFTPLLGAVATYFVASFALRMDELRWIVPKRGTSATS